MKEIEIKKFIEQTGILHNIKKAEVPSSNFSTALSGKINWKNVDYHLSIAFPHTFPYDKPNIYCLSPKFNKHIPNVGLDGYVCYIDNDNYVLDYNNPIEIIREGIERSLNILSREEDKYFTKTESLEFDAYWENYDDCHYALSLVQEKNTITEISTLLTSNNLILGDSRSQIEDYLTRIDKAYNKLTSSWGSALYIPLKKGTKISFPPKDKFWTKTEVWHLITKNIGAWGKAKVKRLQKKRTQPILFKLPLDDGNSIHFGIFFSLEGLDENIKKKKKTYLKVNPISVERLDEKFLLPRGGGQLGLNNKKVAIVGCGAIGSPIALGLAKIGITKLVLIDSDNLKAANIHRHVLGAKDGLNKPKVEGLKKEIEGKYINTTVEAIPKNFETLIKDDNNLLAEFDLIIIATGKPSINLWINQYFSNYYTTIPIIYTWLDPYGIGGHTLITHNQEKSGCYKCLYEMDKEHGMYNLASFAERGQSFLKTQSGCAGLFVPYSSLDAEQTANQTIRQAIKVLNGKELDNPLISWKGETDDFLENGYELSKRYEQNSEKLWQRKYQYKNPKCLICAPAKKGRRFSYGPKEEKSN